MLKTYQVQATEEEKLKLIGNLGKDPAAFLTYLMAPIIGRHTEALEKVLLSSGREQKWKEKQKHIGVPEFHKKMFRLMCTYKFLKINLAMPRGYAKTTLMRLSVLYMAIYHPASFILICNDVHTKAMNSMDTIIEYFLSDNIKQLFGEIKIIENNKKDGIICLLIKDCNLIEKRIYLKALGVKGNARGININDTRPDVIITDDVQKSDISGTGNNYAAAVSFYLGTLLEAGTEYTKFLNIGNHTEQKSLITELKNREDFKTFIFGALDENGVSRWEYQHPTSLIHRKFQIAYKTEKVEVFMAEYMNKPYNKTIQDFDINNIKRYFGLPNIDDFESRVITIDPAFTDKTVNDEAAITVHGFNVKENAWFMLEQTAGRWSNAFDLAEIAVNLAITYDVDLIATEGNMGQTMLVDIIERVCNDKGVFFDVTSFHSANTKHSRIKAFMGMLNNKLYVLPTDDNGIIFQALSYDFNKTKNSDDRIDSAAMILHLLKDDNSFMYREDYATRRHDNFVRGLSV